MNSNNRNKREIVLDLTSLLDVIFIVLLIVMVSQKQKMAEYDDKVKDFDQKMSVINPNEELYKNVDEYVYFISIVAYYDEDEPQERTVKLLTGVNIDELKEFELSGGNTEVAFENIEQTVRDLIAQQEGIPVFISLNSGDEKILYRDEVRLKEMIEAIQDENNLVYLKKGSL